MPAHTAVPSTNSEHVGRTEPRLWTPPLRELTPETTYGYDVIDFSEQVLGIELDPWQKWLAVHMGELLPDLRPRFRTAMALVARQNGKTTLSKVLILYWMVIEQVAMVLSTSTNRTYALHTWREVCDMAEECAWIDITGTRQSTGDEVLTIGRSNYRFAASNGRAGRSLTVHRLLLDELREQRNWDAWDAATKAMQAVPDGQVVCISNQGDTESVVLDSLRTSALDYIETGEGDARLGLFEWSAPPGSDPTDPEAIAAANPSLGLRIQLDAVAGDAARAKRAGGEELAGFRTEVLCQKVHLLDAAIDEQSWIACAGHIADLSTMRDRVALGLDVSLNGAHASLVAAVQHDGRVHVDVVKEWDGYGATTDVRKELPGIISKVRPRIIGWFPNGPAASIAAELRSGWAPRGTLIQEISSDMTSVCMGLAEQVASQQITHADDPMLGRHITLAQKLRRGDAWVFTRSGSGPIDAAYATAAAVHLARTMPPPRPPAKLYRVT